MNSSSLSSHSRCRAHNYSSLVFLRRNGFASDDNGGYLRFSTYRVVSDPSQRRHVSNDVYDNFEGSFIRLQRLLFESVTMSRAEEGFVLSAASTFFRPAKWCKGCETGVRRVAGTIIKIDEITRVTLSYFYARTRTRINIHVEYHVLLSI